MQYGLKALYGSQHVPEFNLMERPAAGGRCVADRPRAGGDRDGAFAAYRKDCGGGGGLVRRRSSLPFTWTRRGCHSFNVKALAARCDGAFAEGSQWRRRGIAAAALRWARRRAWKGKRSDGIG